MMRRHDDDDGGDVVDDDGGGSGTGNGSGGGGIGKNPPSPSVSSRPPFSDHQQQQQQRGRQQQQPTSSPPPPTSFSKERRRDGMLPSPSPSPRSLRSAARPLVGLALLATFLLLTFLAAGRMLKETSSELRGGGSIRHHHQQQRPQPPARRASTNIVVGNGVTTHAIDAVNTVNHLRAVNGMNANNGGDGNNPDGNSRHRHQQCGLYLAESAVQPNSGLGVFAGDVGFHPGDPVGVADICIFVSDMDEHPVQEWMHLRTHTFGRNFFNQHEGRITRAACEGLATNVNTVPDRMVNAVLVSPQLPTNAGLSRKSDSKLVSAGAGAVSPNFGMHGRAVDTVRPGSEITINYGDWPFDETETRYEKPERPVEWLREHGWCIDNVVVGPSTYPEMGRGAFARRPLREGQVVVPAPLQVFRDRSVFMTRHEVKSRDGSGDVELVTEEQLFVNYCFQPRNSKMLLFPYGQGVNLINHASNRRMKATASAGFDSIGDGDRPEPNVYLRWSRHEMHRGTWLDLPYPDEFWKVAKPGGLILEVVASRPIEIGEELFMDYGPEWEDAWLRHVESWVPPTDVEDYAYPAEMDETAPLRTVYEQKTDPYPSNLVTTCSTPDWSSRRYQAGRNITWYDPEGHPWWQTMAYCHILERLPGPTGDPVYTVQLVWKSDRLDFDYEADAKRSADVLHGSGGGGREDRYIDHQVPRRAIRFVERPYADDEHLPNAFRHPIALPDELTPASWRDLPPPAAEDER